MKKRKKKTTVAAAVPAAQATRLPPQKKSKSKRNLNYWDQLISNYKPPGRPAKGGTKRKATRKPKAKKTMAKKTKAEYEDAGDTPATTETPQPREGEETLPPPDPPTVPSLPTEPPAPDAVEDIPQKGIQPEEVGFREMDIHPGSTPGEGPRPEEPEAPPVP